MNDPSPPSERPRVPTFGMPPAPRGAASDSAYGLGVALDLPEERPASMLGDGSSERRWWIGAAAAVAIVAGAVLVLTRSAAATSELPEPPLPTAASAPVQVQPPAPEPAPEIVRPAAAAAEVVSARGLTPEEARTSAPAEEVPAPAPDPVVQEAPSQPVPDRKSVV